jgi:hypothetical protein
MTRAEISALIKKVGLPAAYLKFSKATAKAPPFICYYYPQNNDFNADNTNYARIDQLVVELYTDNKDFELEEKLEGILIANEICFGKTEEYLDDEKMYMITYTTEVLIDGK